jgi:hypothetical protein
MSPERFVKGESERTAQRTQKVCELARIVSQGHKRPSLSAFPCGSSTGTSPNSCIGHSRNEELVMGSTELPNRRRRYWIGSI